MRRADTKSKSSFGREKAPEEEEVLTMERGTGFVTRHQIFCGQIVAERKRKLQSGGHDAVHTYRKKGLKTLIT